MAGKVPLLEPCTREGIQNRHDGLREPQDHYEEGPGNAVCCLPKGNPLSAHAHVLRGVRTAGTSATLYGIRAGRQRTGCPLSSVIPMVLLPRASHFKVQQAPPVVTSRPFGQGWRAGGDCDPTSGSMTTPLTPGQGHHLDMQWQLHLGRNSTR